MKRSHIYRPSRRAFKPGKGLSLPSALDTAFVEMMEHATFDWPERSAGERARSGSAEIGATGVTLAGLAVLACRAIGLMMRDRRGLTALSQNS